MFKSELIEPAPDEFAAIRILQLSLESRDAPS